MNHRMARVSRAMPCPICKRPDWCLVGETAVICMRVASTKQKIMADGSVGYIHSKDGDLTVHLAFHKKEPPVVSQSQLAAMMNNWSSRTCSADIASAAKELGVDSASLRDLGFAMRDKATMAFPMYNGTREIIGIRLRTRDGAKFSVTGSRNGLFIPSRDPQPMVFLPEGPTSTAAALTLGVYAVGRPNAGAGVYDILALAKTQMWRRAVILADADVDRLQGDNVINSGVRGAETLAIHMPIPSIILTLPCKDMREFISSGGDKSTLMYLVNRNIWRMPK